MNFANQKLRSGLVLLVAGLWLGPCQVRADVHAQARGKTTMQRKSHTSKKATASKKSAASKPRTTVTRVKKASHSSSKRRRLSSRRYRAQLRPAPSRIEEIQNALVQAGYLKAEPTGKWDNDTREAMRRYQADHGFAATGLPEAKSLMKLGLGPHPLPEDVDPSAMAQARSNAIGSSAASPTKNQSDPPPAPRE